MQIRRYDDRDRDSVMALAPRLTTGVAPWRGIEAVTAAVCAWVDASLESHHVDDRPVFVADDDGRIVGFASAATRKHWSGDVDAYIGELVVAENCRARGIGRSLVLAIESWARAAGLNRIMLETGAMNVTGLAFYAALGYTTEEVVLTRELA